MSTPSATGGKPPSAHSAATPQNTSQFYTFSSPAPRSAPSPAPSKPLAGKSPFNASSHSALAGRTTDMSPANLNSFESPAGMVPSLSNMGFGEAGFHMAYGGSGMGGLGLSASLGGRLDEHERRRRLESIVTTLRTRYPRLSPQGVELVGQRLDMDILLDPPQGTRRDGTRSCTLAGDTIAVEIAFQHDNRVESVEVSGPAMSEAVTQHLQSAGTVLKADLSEPDMPPILRKLDKFATNLERLAKMDKLNSSTKSETFSCFEAISGVYSSLKRLFEHEKKAAETLIDLNQSHREARIERQVMCRMSGRPTMNNRNVVGLSLDYWMQKRAFFKPTSTSDMAMDVDEAPTDPSPDIADQRVFSLLIDCEACSSELYPPVRVSDAWLPDSFEGAADANDVFGPAISWLDPPSTFVSANDSSGDPTAIAQANKLPDIRFVAKLDPPLIMPAQIVESLLASVGLQPDPANMSLYHNVLLGITEVDQLEFVGREKTISAQRRTVARQDNDQSADVIHQSYLTPKNPVFARTLQEMPFSHPRQIVEMLPILRQWALINSLLTQSFGGSGLSNIAALPSSVIDVTFDANLAGFGIRFPTGQSILTSSYAASGSLTARLLASQADARRSYEASFRVGPNAEITMTDQHLGDESISAAEAEFRQDQAAKAKLLKVARNLDIASDLDVWVEWLKHWITQGQP